MELSPMPAKNRKQCNCPNRKKLEDAIASTRAPLHHLHTRHSNQPTNSTRCRLTRDPCFTTNSSGTSPTCQNRRGCSNLPQRTRNKRWDCSGNNQQTKQSVTEELGLMTRKDPSQLTCCTSKKQPSRPLTAIHSRRGLKQQQQKRESKQQSNSFFCQNLVTLN